MNGLTMESFAQDFNIAIIGLIIVGLALAAISFVLYLLKFIGTEEKPKEEPPKAQAPQPVKAPEVTEAPKAQPAQDNQAEIVAAIVAALSASLNTSPDKLVVRSFRKASPWRETAKRQVQN